MTECKWKIKDGYRYCDGGHPCDQCGCGVWACYCDPCRPPDRMQKCTCVAKGQAQGGGINALV